MSFTHYSSDFKKPFSKMRILDFILLSLILVPLSVDNWLSISVSDYHLRINYFAAALVCIIALLAHTKEYVRAIRSWVFPFLGLFWMSGFLGLTQSTFPTRTLFFLGWNLFTFVSVFTVTWYFIKIRQFKILEILLHYTAFQALIICLDSILCIPSSGALHIGRVMVYEAAGGFNLCRPHAFYQEPGYFCAFALLVVSIYFALSPLRRLNFRKWSEIIIILVAVFLTTSRMGWIGIILLASIQPPFRRFVIKRAKKPAQAIPALLVLIGFGLFAGPVIYHHVGRGLIHPSEDGSFVYRKMRTEKALLVFRQSPLVGVGAGTAGAYFVDHYPSDEWLKSQTPGYVDKLRRDPLSQNLYTEILSEWGLVGFTLFLLAIYSILRRIQNRGQRFAVALLLALIYTSTQTLARFDLWFCLATLFNSIPVTMRRRK